MPSPFHQKYSSQTHKIFGDNPIAIMPEGPKDGADRRTSNASINSTSPPASPTDRRRSSTTQRFGNLEALKRSQDVSNRRQSVQDAYSKPGFIGSMWHNFTRGGAAATSPQMQQPKEPRDTTTLRH